MAKDIMIPLFGTRQFITLEDFANLTPKKYKQITGKRLSLGDKVRLAISKRYARKLIDKDGTVSNESLKKKFGFFDRWSWHWGGFALGFLLILGPLIALFFNDDYKWDRFWTAMTTASALMAGLLLLLGA